MDLHFYDKTMFGWFSRLWRGVNRCCGKAKFSFACQKRTRNGSRAGSAGLERGYAGLSSLLRAKREPEMVLALVARGMFFLTVKWLALRAGQRQGGVFRLPPPYLWTPLSPQRVKGCSPLTNPRRKSKPKNASRFAKRIFLCFSHLRLRR